MNIENNKPKLTIVIPCYNEEAVLPFTITRLYDVLNDLIIKNKIQNTSSLLFINDGSIDKTRNILQHACLRDNKRIKSIHFTKNFGNQNAIIAGLKTAVVNLNSDCAITIDALFFIFW